MFLLCLLQHVYPLACFFMVTRWPPQLQLSHPSQPGQYEFPMATVTNCHKCGDLSDDNLFSHWLEARSLKSVSLSWNQGIGRAILPPNALGEHLFLASSSFWRLSVSHGLWLHYSNLCLHIHTAFSSAYVFRLYQISFCLFLGSDIQDTCDCI